MPGTTTTPDGRAEAAVVPGTSGPRTAAAPSREGVGTDLVSGPATVDSGSVTLALPRETGPRGQPIVHPPPYNPCRSDCAASEATVEACSVRTQSADGLQNGRNKPTPTDNDQDESPAQDGLLVTAHRAEPPEDRFCEAAVSTATALVRVGAGID